MTGSSGRMVYEAAAEALGFPDEHTLPRISALRGALQAHLPPDSAGLAEALEGLDILWEEGACEGIDRLEERYTAAFDLQPLSTLGCGYHVFGESYKRGRLLSGLEESLRRYGIAGVPERLPDELPVLLRLLPELSADGPEGAEEAFELLAVCVLPALTKMTDAFSKSDNPWGAVIRAVRVLLESDRPDAVEASASMNSEVFLP